LPFFLNLYLPARDIKVSIPVTRWEYHSLDPNEILGHFSFQNDFPFAVVILTHCKLKTLASKPKNPEKTA